jgi:NAD+ diphosphatase
MQIAPMNSLTDPEHIFSFCPKCGAHAFQKCSEKKFQCTACEFIYYFNANGATAAIIQTGIDEILLTVRSKNPGKGKWDLPGGFIDFNESVEEALQREIDEELNLQITNLRYFCSYPNRYEFGGLLYHTIDLFYLCHPEDLSTLKLCDEVSDYRLQNIHEIDIDAIAFPSIKNVIHRLQSP